MTPKETRFYYRQSEKFHNSVVKIEVFNGTDWLNGMELESSYKARSLSPIGRKLDATICLMKAYGLQDVHIPRLLSRKQVRIKSEVLPLEELKDKLGWSPLDYPSNSPLTIVVLPEPLPAAAIKTLGIFKFMLNF